MIVSNTTPISNLLHLHNISLLEKLFGSVYIPQAVADALDVVFSENREWVDSIERKKMAGQPLN